jgi:hypothetical protein
MKGRGPPLTFEAGLQLRLFQWNIPFSRSACTPGPGPLRQSGQDKSSADVDRIHVAGAGVGAARLGVAIVETAARIEMGSGGNHVHPFRFSLDRNARCPVVAVTHSRRNRDAIDLVTARRDRQRVRRGAEVGTVGARSFVMSAGGDGEVVVPRRLIVNPSDDAGGVCAECILRRGVRVAVRKQSRCFGWRYLKLASPDIMRRYIWRIAISPYCARRRMAYSRPHRYRRAFV